LRVTNPTIINHIQPTQCHNENPAAVAEDKEDEVEDEAEEATIEEATDKTDKNEEETDTTIEESATTHAEEVRHCRIHPYHEGQRLTKFLQEKVAPAHDHRDAKTTHETQEPVHHHGVHDRETTDHEKTAHREIPRNHNLRDRL
jgi:hypothetical protein